MEGHGISRQHRVHPAGRPPALQKQALRGLGRLHGLGCSVPPWRPFYLGQLEPTLISSNPGQLEPTTSLCAG